jgi:hypothetical protein
MQNRMAGRSRTGAAIANRRVSAKQELLQMRRLLMLFLAVITVAACDNDPTSFEEAIAGTYTLQSIAGAALPVTIHNDTAVGRVEYTASEILVGINGVYRQIDSFRTTKGTAVTLAVDTFTAVWTPGTTVNTMTFTTQTSQGPFSFTGAWNGTNTITMVIDGEQFVYRR